MLDFAAAGGGAALGCRAEISLTD